MRRTGRFLGMAVLVIAGIAALGAVVMLLWNAVMPALFTGALTIDYPHALGLLVLSRILFGGFRRHGGWQGRRHFAKWESLSAEEREKFMRCRPWGRRNVEAESRS